MTTFLELVRELRAETTIAGSEAFPASVANQTGDYADLVRWVRQAYIDIQNMHGGQWRWLRRQFTFQTIADQAAYAWGDIDDVRTAAAIDRFNRWAIQNPREPVRCYLTSAGIATEYPLIYADWDAFRYLFDMGAQTSQQPAYISINDQDELVLGPAPSDVYTVRGVYWRGPQVLTMDAELPEMPTQFHHLVVLEALRKYGYRHVASEALSRSNHEGTSMMTSLENNQLPQITFAAPLA